MKQDATSFYLGFNEAFWNTQFRLALSDPKEPAFRAALSLQYRALLEENKDLLNVVFLGNEEPERLPRSFYSGLEDLGVKEHAHGLILSKISLEDTLPGEGGNLTPFQSTFLRGRTSFHLARLLLPKVYSREHISLCAVQLSEETFSIETCATFAKDYLAYVATLKPRKDNWNFEGTEISNRIGAEGPGVFLFWTVAPYVHADLMRRGLTPAQSFAKIFEWIKASRSGFEFSPNHQFPYNFELKTTNPLGYDERMPTHLRANLFARTVAREL